MTINHNSIAEILMTQSQPKPNLIPADGSQNILTNYYTICNMGFKRREMLNRFSLRKIFRCKILRLIKISLNTIFGIN